MSTKLLTVCVVVIVVAGIAFCRKSHAHQELSMKNLAEQLFFIITPKDQLSQALLPMVESMAQENNVPAEHKQAFGNQFIEMLFEKQKESFVASAEKTLTQQELQDTLLFFQSESGRAWAQKSLTIYQAGGAIFGSMQTIAQEIAKLHGGSNNVQEEIPVYSKNRVDFDDLVKYNAPMAQKEVFELIVEHDVTVIKLFATWCPPCKAYAPTFNAVAESLQEIVAPDGQKIAVRYSAINIDTNPEVGQIIGATQIPTTAIFYNGALKGKFVGALNDQTLIKHIQDSVA